MGFTIKPAPTGNIAIPSGQILTMGKTFPNSVFEKLSAGIKNDTAAIATTPHKKATDPLHSCNYNQYEKLIKRREYFIYRLRNIWYLYTMCSDRLARFAAIASVALLFGGAPSSAHGSTLISDDQSSANFIANQIANSSGSNPGNYDRYSRKLARTLSLLSPEQQARVLGSVSMGDGGDDGGDVTEGGTGESGTGEDNFEGMSDEEVAAMRAFEEMLMGGDSSWDGNSEPWWWSLFRELFQHWLAAQEGGGR